MCLQGSSIGLRMLKRFYSLDSRIVWQCFVGCFQELPPRNLTFESCILVTALLGLMVDQDHPSWIAFGFESKFFLIIVICKQKIACQCFANCALGGLQISLAISLSAGSKSQLCVRFRTISIFTPKLPTSKQMFGWPRRRFCGDVKRWRIPL